MYSLIRVDQFQPLTLPINIKWHQLGSVHSSVICATSQMSAHFFLWSTHNSPTHPDTNVRVCTYVCMYIACAHTVRTYVHKYLHYMYVCCIHAFTYVRMYFSIFFLKNYYKHMDSIYIVHSVHWVCLTHWHSIKFSNRCTPLHKEGKRRRLKEVVGL